jgi:hypothetical protein
MTEDIQQVPSTSPNFRNDRARLLEELVPEVSSDGIVDLDAINR